MILQVKRIVDIGIKEGLLIWILKESSGMGGGVCTM